MRLLIFAVVLPLFGCAQFPENKPPITLLHTNDHHGRFWPNSDGEYGLAARTTLVKHIRQEVRDNGGIVLLLSGGDINTGVPESDMQHAEPDFRGMSLLDYDAMALGNHEFDNPIDVLRQQHQWAGFPFLSANVIDNRSGEPLFSPYHIFERHGVTIAVIGLTTTDTYKIGNPEYVGGLSFTHPTQAVLRSLDRIHQHYRTDMVIALTHMGHFENGQSGSNAPGDVTLARQLPTGSLDAIIGGHSQDPVCMAPSGDKIGDYQPDQHCQPDRHNDIWIMQAYEWGKYLGRADFVYRDGQYQLEDYALLPVNLVGSHAPRLEPDADMVALLTPYQNLGHAELQKVIGHSEHRFDADRRRVRSEPMPIGQLITRAQGHAVSADISVVSGGGIRDALPQGELTYKDVLKVHPFGNTVGVVTLKGIELADYIRAVNRSQAGSGAYPQWSGLTINNGDIFIEGTPLQPRREYRLSVNSFNASGGDGYPVLTSHPNYVDTGLTDAGILKQYIQNHSPLIGTDYLPQ